MYKLIAVTAFIFLSVSIQAQESQKDSLNLALKKTVTDTGRIHVLIKLADLYSNYPNNEGIKTSLDSADIYLRQASKLNKEQYGVYFKNRINVLSARVYCELNQATDPSTLFLPIITACKKNGDKLNEM